MQLIEIAGFPIIDLESMTFHDAVNAPKKANSDAIGGFTDWVLPDTQTLRALALLKPEDSWFWSSSPYDDHSNYAWYVGFYGGGVDGSNKKGFNRVLLVRAEQCLEIGKVGLLKSINQAGIQLLN